MSSSESHRPIRLPPLDFSERSIPIKSLKASTWYRIHFKRHDPIHFSASSEHRFSHPKAGCRWLYLAEDFETGALERLGDRLFDHDGFLEGSLWMQLRLSSVSLPPLAVCDLSNTRTRSACRVDLASLNSADLSVPQAWGLAIAKHPADFQGIIYRSRFTSQRCIAVTDKAEASLPLRSTPVSDFIDYSPAAQFLERHHVALV